MPTIHVRWSIECTLDVDRNIDSSFSVRRCWISLRTPHCRYLKAQITIPTRKSISIPLVQRAKIVTHHQEPAKHGHHRSHYQPATNFISVSSTGEGHGGWRRCPATRVTPAAGSSWPDIAARSRSVCPVASVGRTCSSRSASCAVAPIWSWRRGSF
jgi:hypothetical protein